MLVVFIAIEAVVEMIDEVALFDAAPPLELHPLLTPVRYSAEMLFAIIKLEIKMVNRITKLRMAIKKCRSIKRYCGRRVIR